MERSPARRRILLLAGLAVVLGVSSFAGLEPGITWDEPSYVASGYQYVHWFRTLSTASVRGEGIDRYWRLNSEHPPAAKLAYGLAAHAAERLNLDPFLAARLAAAAMFTLLVGLVGWFVAVHYGLLAGVLAALATVLMPRLFGHGHLAALDLPVALACLATTMCFGSVVCATRSGDKVRCGLAVLAGILWGIALLTKLNAVFLPVVLIPWALVTWRRKALLPLLLLLVVGGGTFFAGWPWLWQDTVHRARLYALNKTERMSEGERPTGTSDIPVYYLGKRYVESKAPWHYPLVLTVATVPLGLLLLAGVGAGYGTVRRNSRSVTVLIVASAALHLAVFMLPMVPKYDGVRLFLPAFPFIACLAGVGGGWLWHWRIAGRPLVVLVLGFTAASLVFTAPYELSYYSEAVGGAWGAHKLGLETTYWGDTVTRSVLQYLNENSPDGSRISILPDYMESLQALPGLKDSLIRQRPGPSSIPPDYVVVFPRQGMLGDRLGEVRKTHRLVRQWDYLGVPQCLLFSLRRD